ncbi:MAG: hypothetical protein HY399_06505 [Elusimicrobia bacterium]|nr:hypothetical protein [Elusimicrobiota bacterium]
MRLHRYFFLLLGFLFFIPSPTQATFSLKGKLIQMVGEILANPAAFFYDFQQDLEATHPLPPGKSLGFQINAFPSFIPFTYGNLSTKIRLHPEGRWTPGLPQFDLIGGYWNMVIAKVAADSSDDVKEANFQGYYGGLVATSSLEPRVRLFWGYKFAQLRADLELNEAVDIVSTPVSSFKSGLRDHFFFAGIEHPTGIDKTWILQLGYGLQNQIISSKVSWMSKHWEFGLNIYPESPLVLHPVVNYHLNF